MPVTVAEFAKAARESGILAPDVLAEYIKSVAPENDATALATRLVEDGRLSAFQARYIRGGKAKSLLLGPYVLLDVLGRGGMGHVYKAEHRTMRRVVAIKLISTAALESPDAIRRFEREVQAAARLEHPNVVTAFDAGSVAGNHYLVMQYVEGRNLSEVVKEVGPQPVARTIDWILQAARGLAFAHEQGVIHRDIKPGNLIIDSRGTVKILDMGLARFDTLGADQDQLTGAGQIMGTVDYMAPEQAQDTRQADARADIYSLGATLWYLLTGRPLFAGETAMSKLVAHMQAPVPRLREVRGDVPPDVETVFQRMVAKKPVDRFQSMQDLITTLEPLQQASLSPYTPRMLLKEIPATPVSSGTAATQTLQPLKGHTADRNADDFPPVTIETQTHIERIDGRREPRWRGRRSRLGAMIALGLTGILAVVGAGIVSLMDGTGASGKKAGDTTGVNLNRGRRDPRGPSVAAGTPALAVVPFPAGEAERHQQVWADHLGEPVEKEITLPGDVKLVMVLIPPGEFTRNDDHGQPLSRVRLTKPFYIGKHEVTQKQWHAVMRANPSAFDARPEHPVEMVSWVDISLFLSRINANVTSGFSVFALPTDAQWEYACRAGATTRFFFGDSDLDLPRYAWFQMNSGGESHAVGQLEPNAFGLHDTNGNVWEWCQDWHEKGYSARAPEADPPGPATGGFRITRGGGWNGASNYCRAADHYWNDPAQRLDNLGFRLALNLANTPEVPAAAAKP